MLIRNPEYQVRDEEQSKDGCDKAFEIQTLREIILILVLIIVILLRAMA